MGNALTLKGFAFWVKNLTRSYEGLLLLAAKVPIWQLVNWKSNFG